MMLDVSTIPQFREMHARDCRDFAFGLGFLPPTEIRKFWEEDNVTVRGTKITYDFLGDYKLSVHCGVLGVHPAAMFEICEYFNIPYPKMKIDLVLKEEIKLCQVTGAEDGRKLKVSCLRDAKNSIEKIEEILNSLVPKICKADNTKLEAARLLAARDVLLWVLKMKRAFVAGYTVPAVFE